MNAERFRAALFLGLLAVALGLCFGILLPFLSVLAWAGLLTVLVSPLYRRLAMRIRQPSLAALLACLLALAVVIVPAGLLAFGIGLEVTSLARELQVTAPNGDLARRFSLLEIPAGRRVLAWIEQAGDRASVDLEPALRQAAGQAGSWLMRQSAGIVRGVALASVQAVITLLTLFFLLRDGHRLRAALLPFLPLEDHQIEALFARAREMIHAVVYGQLVVATAQGTLAGLAFWALGLPAPLLWGLATTALCLIPLAGAPVVWLPGALLLAAQGAYGKAVALALWGALVVSTVDNLLRPILVGARTQLHPLLVFFSLLGGLLLLGTVGLFLGPVIFVMTLMLLEVLQSRLQQGTSEP